MADPLTTDANRETDPGEEPIYPVEVDLETPEGDALDQAIPVVLDDEGYPPT